MFQNSTGTPAPADGPPPTCCAPSSSPRSWPTPPTATVDDDAFTIHLATSRDYTLALSPAA